MEIVRTYEIIEVMSYFKYLGICFSKNVGPQEDEQKGEGED